MFFHNKKNMLRPTHFQLARHMHPSEMHPLLDFWLHPQNGWQVDARYAYCTNDKWHAIASHTIWCHIIGRAHLCIFIITAIAVPVTQLSAVTTQTSNDLWLLHARVIRVITSINAFSAMSALSWYHFWGHCTMFAFLHRTASRLGDLVCSTLGLCWGFDN